RLTTWQSTDPALPSTATNTTSLSTYLYANANPINYTDPDGRNPRKPIAAGPRNLVAAGGGSASANGRTPIAAGGGSTAKALPLTAPGRMSSYRVAPTEGGFYVDLFRDGAGIRADMSPDGVVHLEVEAVQGVTPRGTEMYNAAMTVFGENVKTVHAKWVTSMPTNLDEFNKALLDNPGLSEESAALNHTWSGRRAQDWNFDTATVTKRVGVRGQYTQIEVDFTRSGAAAGGTLAPVASEAMEPSGVRPRSVNAVGAAGAAINILGLIIMWRDYPALQNWAFAEGYRIRLEKMGGRPGDSISCDHAGCGLHLSPEHNNL
ncbi:hypothetical protein, partial [Kribbella ginsengisoli]|uniref:hypothetical protein n=1 Tax=Kribbella ginsengisoli TaxID=363865 RepID=UPI0031DCF3A3